MEYTHILPGIFIERPNRFIARVIVNGAEQICHVKNTGRCRELLVPGAEIFVQQASNPLRKTAFDLISVYKGETLVNVDSQAPNRVFREWLEAGRLIPGVARVKPEAALGNSRFDFYVESQRAGQLVKSVIEVKGVTLEEDGVALFPDAPTMRGVKHLHELARLAAEGYEAYAVFIIQMKGVARFQPNSGTDTAFCNALIAAKKQAVRIVALDSIVTESGITADRPVPVFL